MDKETEITKTDIKQDTMRGCCIPAGSHSRGQTVDQHRCCKLASYNWLPDVSGPNTPNYVEVRFKNDHKDFFSYPPEMRLLEGEIVAVEASPGHEIGIVSLTGDTVRLQMKRKNFNPENREVRRIFRHARPVDIEKWFEAMSLEKTTMNKTRVIVMDLGLEMKINDVEYQGDKTKAIFYYTASERVDFRELIKKLAEAFHIRIEMRQIGTRQEAAKLGGIGSCGRELCCSSWINNFRSVSTTSARIQQLSLNPQKLVGQCGKLKCCLNFELENYVETLREFPDNRIRLKTKKGDAVYQKSDVFKKTMWYAYADDATNILAIPIDKVKEIIAMNRKGKMIDDLESWAQQQSAGEIVEMEGDDDFVDFI